MKRIVLLAILMAARIACFSQTYIMFAPSLTNTAGTYAEKSNIAIEIGRQWDVFSLGLDIGKTTLAKVMGKDTTTYLEIRPNLNVFQQGKFTNTLTPGIGYVFNGEQDFVTELTSGIEYAYNNTWHLNISFGQYYYSGKVASSNVTFFGLSVMYYFKPTKAKSLFNIQQATGK